MKDEALVQLAVEAPAYTPRAARRGHVESYFVKLHSPDGARALWLKWTIFAGPGAEPREECWAVAFQRGGPQRAFKRSAPLGARSICPTPVVLDFAGARFDGRRAQGTLESAGGTIAWDVSLLPRCGPLRQLPYEWMYRGPLPESKFTSPLPDADASGWFALDGERVRVDGWRAMHGHNWGSRHAHRYAWCHASGLRGGDDVIFEAVAARLRKGIELPWLTLAFLRIDGRWVRFDTPRSLTRAHSRVSVMRWRFEVASGPWRLCGEASARPEDTVGLHYPNPKGALTYCLNSKLAALDLEVHGPEGSRTFTTTSAALELGWPSADHGIVMVA